MCCFASAAPVRVGCFLSLPAARGPVRVLPFLCCWSALAGRLFVLKCACWGFCYTYSHYCVFPLHTHALPKSHKCIHDVKSVTVGT